MKANLFLKLFVCIFIITFLFSCSKEEEAVVEIQQPPVTLSDMLLCHRLGTWDSTTISNKLMGAWDWEFIQCFWNPEDASYESYKGVTIDFKAPNIVEVKENGVLTQTSQWKIVNLNDGFWGLKTEPLVLLIPGRITFCDERVLFDDSYVDGCNNYFKRKN